jgi:hypothetical protein
MQTIDYHTFTITANAVGESFWTGTIRTADNIISGHFFYGHIEELDTDTVHYHVGNVNGSLVVEEWGVA